MNGALIHRNISQLAALHPQREAQANHGVTRGYDLLAVRDLVYPGFFTRKYMNFGFWERDTTSRQAASENLMRRLTAHIVDRTGTVLDVACGLGFTSLYLAERWSPARVHGINVGEAQLACCRRNAPGCIFSAMDAATLALADRSFDHIVCVEAAFHFQTRAAFLGEAWRVLKPGGTLTLTDLILHEDGHNLLPAWRRVNHIPSLEAYLHVVEQAGFGSVDLSDITQHGVQSYLRFMFTQVHDDWLRGVCDYRALQMALDLLHRIAVTHRFNVMCVARKD